MLEKKSAKGATTIASQKYPDDTVPFSSVHDRSQTSDLPAGVHLAGIGSDRMIEFQREANRFLTLCPAQGDRDARFLALWSRFFPFHIDCPLGFSSKELLVVTVGEFLGSLCPANLRRPKTLGRLKSIREAEQPFEFQVVIDPVRLEWRWHEFLHLLASGIPSSRGRYNPRVIESIQRVP
jgi:hypothetical protein